MKPDKIPGYFPKYSPSPTHFQDPGLNSMPCSSDMLPLTVPVISVFLLPTSPAIRHQQGQRALIPIKVQVWRVIIGVIQAGTSDVELQKEEAQLSPVWDLQVNPDDQFLPVSLAEFTVKTTWTKASCYTVPQPHPKWSQMITGWECMATSGETYQSCKTCSLLKRESIFTCPWRAPQSWSKVEPWRRALLKDLFKTPTWHSYTMFLNVIPI